MERGSSIVPHPCTRRRRLPPSGIELVTVFQGRVPVLGSCGACDAVVRLDSFRRRDALRAFTDGTRRCQVCQDIESAGIESAEELRYGAVVGFGLDCQDQVDFTDTGFLPFRFAPSRNWYEWEPRFLVRVAQDPSPLDLWHELVPMAGCWRDQQVRVREFRLADDPALLDRLAGLSLLVASDLNWLDAAVDRFSLLSCAARLNLSTILPTGHNRLSDLSAPRSWAWMDGMLAYLPSPEERFSSLRSCALVAALLERSANPAFASFPLHRFLPRLAHDRPGPSKIVS